MFRDCKVLTSLDLSNFNTSSVTNMSYMFRGCDSLAGIDLGSFDTSSVTNMSNMFYGCNSLTNLDLSNFNTSSVTSMSYMFYGCDNITTIYVSNLWTIDAIKSGNGINVFSYCGSLVGGNGTTYSYSKTNYTYAKIDEEGSPGYFTYKESTI